LKPETKQRIASLLDTALGIAERRGLHTLTHAAVADAAGVSVALVKLRMGSIATMRRAVMRAAVQRRCARVVGEGLLAGDRSARKADGLLRDSVCALVRRA
jgi:hypothetical protein